MTEPEPEPDLEEHTVSPARFRAGVAFLVLNYLFGWPFLVVVEALALYFESPDLAILGPIVYGLSWALLGVGLWLAGPEAVTYLKHHYETFLKNRKNRGPS